MNISIELPPGVAPPTLKGTLTGPPEDLRIEIRFNDLLDALKLAQSNGAEVKVATNGHHLDLDAPKALRPLKPTEKLSTVSRKPLPKKASAPEEAPQAIGGYKPTPGTAPYEILIALQKRPLSPLELSAAVGKGITLPNVYTTTANLKGRGLIESFTDETDGTRRWKLCPAK